MCAQVVGPSTQSISQILEAVQLGSGVCDDDLIEIGNAVADWSDLLLGIDLFLRDLAELDLVSRAMMLDAAGKHPEASLPTNPDDETITLSRPQLYALTQRLIFGLGGRAKQTMSNISEVFGATAPQQGEGVGLREFRGFLASVLTQLRKEKELHRCCQEEEDFSTEQAAMQESDQSSRSWLHGVASRLLQTVDDIAIKLDDLVESNPVDSADELMPTTSMLFRSGFQTHHFFRSHTLAPRVSSSMQACSCSRHSTLHPQLAVVTSEATNHDSLMTV